jgi:ribosomal protein S12 methylthiotransferase RimO
VITLGCARNEVDSDELAGRLAAQGWTLVPDADAADVVLVNTCGFVEAAKKDSIDTILSIEDRPVVAVGCLAERYGSQLASALPEAAAVLGFDEYPRIAEQLARIVAGESLPSHEPTDRRSLLPITPVDRSSSTVTVPGHDAPRLRLASGPVASVKLASGCDRRCSFCAIPSFRGSFVSRIPDDIVAEVADLAATGVREVILVSENSTSYGKDLGDLRLLEQVLGRLAAETDIARVRVAYLQPAEVRPSLLAALASVSVVADYYDLSFQHASSSVLRRMRRFGGTQDFLGLIDSVRARAPEAGIRSNVIVGFPGETDDEFAELLAFLEASRLDAIGVFGYSDEDGTEAATLEDKIDQDEIDRRVRVATEIAEEVMAQRAEDRMGSTIVVLIEELTEEGAVGRAAHQGPDDGSTLVLQCTDPVGSFVTAQVIDTEGVDLIAELRG